MAEREQPEKGMEGNPQAGASDLPLLVDKQGQGSGHPRKWLLPCFLVLALVVAGGVYGLRAGANNIASSAETTSLEANAGLSASGDIYGLGVILPLGRVMTIAPPSGSGDARLSGLEVAEGETVKAGSVLARLDNEAQLKAMLEVARATVAAREAALEQTRVSIIASRAEAEAALARGQAQAENAASDFARSKSLAARGVIAGDQLDAKRTLMRETALEAERLKAVLSRFAVADPEAQVDVLLARRTLEQARADLDRAEADLEKAVVRAPVSGTVLKIMARAGERASNSGILRLADLSVMTVDVEIYQSDINRVKPGDAVEISSSALPRMLKGKVERIGLEVGRQTLVDAGPAANTDARVVIATVSLLPEDREIAARFTNLQVTARIQPQGEAASP